MLWSAGGGILILGYGIFLFMRPDLLWRLTERWKSYRADEPSELYRRVTKVAGILFALLGMIMVVLPFVLE